MELWMSAEIHHTVDAAYTVASRSIETTLNGILGSRDYGEGLREWAWIAIILPEGYEEYEEVAKYRRKMREVEFRLRIDYSGFLCADAQGHITLIGESLLRSIDMMPGIGVRDVDFDRLRKDVESCLSDLAGRAGKTV
jgi:hypothetical protein